MDALTRLDHEPTDYQRAQDRYDEAQYTFESTRTNWIRGECNDEEMLKAADTLDLAEADLHAERQAVAADANELPF